MMRWGPPLLAALGLVFGPAVQGADLAALAGKIGHEAIKDPEVAAACGPLLKGEDIPRWAETLAASVPAVLVQDGEESWLYLWACQPHDCYANRLYLIYQPGRCYGLLETGPLISHPRYLGDPPPAVVQLLERLRRNTSETAEAGQ